MSALRVVAFAHVMGAILATGYALFWVILATVLRREEPADAAELLAVAARSRWPPAGPHRLRITLPLVGWAFLALLAMTGLWAASLYDIALGGLVSGASPWGAAMTIKLSCLALLVAAQIALSVRPTAAVAYLGGAATLAVLLFSALLRH